MILFIHNKILIIHKNIIPYNKDNISKNFSVAALVKWLLPNLYNIEVDDDISV